MYYICIGEIEANSNRIKVCHICIIIRLSVLDKKNSPRRSHINHSNNSDLPSKARLNASSKVYWLLYLPNRNRPVNSPDNIAADIGKAML